jgi:DNA-binding NarL/FixJ family response regulator
MMSSNPRERRDLLLVDDDPNLILLVKDYLEFQGYTVTTAENGREALEVLKESKPSLIVCDIMMPDLDGYGFMERVRQDRQYDSIPAIFLSAKGQPQDRIKGLNHGADVYMVKPFEPEELVAQVESSLRQSERMNQRGKLGSGLEITALKVSVAVSLTPTEKRVIRHVARGLANRDIAAELNISQRTVESHVSNVLGKTGLSNRTELARWAIATEID